MTYVFITQANSVYKLDIKHSNVCGRNQKQKT